MSLHSTGQMNRQTHRNNKNYFNNPNSENYNIREEDIISSIYPSVVNFNIYFILLT